MTPSLPMEIIQLIFHELRPDISEKMIATALTVSAISQHWRAVALSTPSLWSKFSFRLRAHHITDLLPILFERSLPDPLDATVIFNFHTLDESDMLKVQGAIALLRSQADRVEGLHLRFLGYMSSWNGILAQFVEFRSSSLKHLEMEALPDGDVQARTLIEYFHSLHPTQRWSERCPALTHVTCTDPRMLVYRPSRVTYLCINGVPGRRNVVDIDDLLGVLVETHILTELVIDGVSLGLSTAPAPPSPLPCLHTLFLRPYPEPDGNVSLVDAMCAAFFIRLLDAPVLESFAMPELNPNLPLCLTTLRPNSSIPSITRLTLASGSSQSLFEYPRFFPGVTELVLLGTDPKLYGIGSMSCQASCWPHLRIIDLTKLQPPPPEWVRFFSDALYEYGRKKIQSGHRSRVTVRLPRGILPQDLSLDVTEFMDLHAA